MLLNDDFSLPLCSVVTVVDVLSSAFFGLFTVREIKMFVTVVDVLSPAFFGLFTVREIKMFVTTTVFVSIIRTTEYSNSV